MTITGMGAIYVNLSGDMNHTVEFRGEGGQIVDFQVSAEYLDNVRRTVVPQKQPDGMGFTDDEGRQIKEDLP
ncbi:hypothetical protein [Streptomyces justiciae]|uniref:Uncharacterized protein n=1 Tax=Streptomyces justiciae TaxID=2780140 RepID=A0ABU3M7V6_9ACTN|nr:hypothetical protein [Streptomyces justiciae]MDT7846994.1 hypothetical protein [Streptomyces justiciae]